MISKSVSGLEVSEPSNSDKDISSTVETNTEEPAAKYHKLEILETIKGTRKKKDMVSNSGSETVTTSSDAILDAIDKKNKLLEICKFCGFKTKEIVEKANILQNIMLIKGAEDLPILIGFDINGPLVRTEDATLEPYIKTSDILHILSSIPKVKICFITGWDHKSVQQFASDSLGIDDSNIISENGMVYTHSGRIVHLYPNSEAETENFAEVVFEIASRDGLQISIQSNLSSGCQCVYFEAFDRFKLKMNPRNRTIRFNNQTLMAKLREKNIGHFIKNDSIEVMTNAFILYKILKDELPLFPIRLNKMCRPDEGRICLSADQYDNPNYDKATRETTANEIAKLTQRSIKPNKDGCVDFCTESAKKYSKSSAAQNFGKDVFESNFVIFMVGDSIDDHIKGDNVVFFPQIGTDAAEIGSENDIPVHDGREYALVIAYYLLNKS